MFSDDDLNHLEHFKARLIMGDNLSRKEIERVFNIIGYGSQKAKHLAQYGATDKDVSIYHRLINLDLFK